MNVPALLRRKAQPPPPAGVIGPEAMEVFPRRLRAGETWCETFCVTGYPREVSPGWLAPLLAYPGPVDVALHVEPVENAEAAKHLRRQLARFESTRRMEAKRDQLGDPGLEAAAHDAAELAAELARGEGRLFRAGLYVTVRAPSEEALEREVSRVRSLCASLLLDTRPVTFRVLQGWLTTLPLGIDALRMRRTFDTKALAASFPFASAELETAGGIFLGRNATTGGLVFVDRFALDNHNQVILARSGAGKSYLAKVQILRSLYSGVEVLVIDPENEYERLAETVGGTVIRLGPGGERLNPLDLAHAGDADAVTEQALFCHALVSALVEDVSAEEQAALDRAILAAYAGAGITADPKTHARPAPLLAHVLAHLRQTPQGLGLAGRLEPYTSGSRRALFDKATTVRPEGHLVVFSLRDLQSEELKTAGTLVALDAVWRRVVRGERRPRVVVVDEAWWLVAAAGGAGARFMQRLAKSARKHWCGLTAISQEVGDLLSTDLGRAVVANAAHQVLLRQEPQEAEALARVFNLSDGERSYLLTCDKGQGILAVGTERAALQVVASEAEHRLATSSPAELAGNREEGS
ncbi:MAG: VirB4 family type IV secretion system protein [Actinomycetota bacterium]